MKIKFQAFKQTNDVGIVFCFIHRMFTFHLKNFKVHSFVALFYTECFGFNLCVRVLMGHWTCISNIRQPNKGHCGGGGRKSTMTFLFVHAEINVFVKWSFTYIYVAHDMVKENRNFFSTTKCQKKPSKRRMKEMNIFCRHIHTSSLNALAHTNGELHRYLFQLSRWCTFSIQNAYTHNINNTQWMVVAVVKCNLNRFTKRVLRIHVKYCLQYMHKQETAVSWDNFAVQRFR